MVAESKMSSLTDEWHLKRENGIKYWVDIRDFNNKMNWRCGKEIYSRKFKISRSVFSVFINPNGNSSKEKGPVSVYLRNDSSWSVRLSDVSFKVRDHVQTSCGRYYHIGEKCGLPLFVSHKEIEYKSLIDEYGRFRLEVNVELLEEEVLRTRPVDNEGDDLQGLKNEIKEELESQKNEIKSMKGEISRELNQMREELSQMMKMMKMLVANCNARELPRVECPSLTVRS